MRMSESQFWRVARESQASFGTTEIAHKLLVLGQSGQSLADEYCISRQRVNQIGAQFMQRTDPKRYIAKGLRKLLTAPHIPKSLRQQIMAATSSILED